MTDQLDSRVTGTVTAVMDDDEHPIRRSTYTPVEGVAVVDPAADEGVDAPSETADAPTPDAVDARPSETADAPTPERSFPPPPERGSLDDEHLVPLVGRHTDDTATIDLIGILQAQMQLRATEAARFAAWEQQVRDIGTDEALDELERTRLHFTGVIPIQNGPLPFPPAPVPPAPISPSPASPRVVTADDAPTAPGVTALQIEPGKGPAKNGAIIAAGTIPADDSTDRARSADAVLLDRDDASIARTAGTRAAAARSSSQADQGRATSILLASISAVAALVVIAAVILTGLSLAGVSASGRGATVGVASALSAFAVVAAAWLGIVAGRLALRGRKSGLSAPVSARTPWALVAGLVVGAVVGEGLVRGGDSAFAWQGYLLRLTRVEGLSIELSLVVGLVAAAVIAFAVVVLIDRVSPAAGDAAQGDTPEGASITL